MTNTIKDQYWIKKLNAVQSTKYPDRWDVKGDVILSNGNLTKLPLQFGIVTGFFHCSYNKLESLEGCPIEVGGDFYCFDNKLKSLEGAPREVGGDFYCFDNKLKSLEGAPQKIGGDFHCDHNYLKTLEGAPEYVGGNFNCIHNELNTLKGAPQKVGGHFSCLLNPLEHLNHLLDVQIKGNITIYEDYCNFIKALQNTNLDALEYTLNNHNYLFGHTRVQKEFYMNIEQIIVKKRLEKVLHI